MNFVYINSKLVPKYTHINHRLFAVVDLHFWVPLNLNYYGCLSSQTATIVQHPTRSEWPFCRWKDPDAQIAESGWRSEVLENGRYIEPLPTSNKVWVTVVLQSA